MGYGQQDFSGMPGQMGGQMVNNMGQGQNFVRGSCVLRSGAGHR